MDRGLVTLLGMSIAYVASFIGLGLAWWSWKRRVADDDGSAHSQEGSGSRDRPVPGDQPGTHGRSHGRGTESAP
jgi:hypothetical protein